MPEEAEGDAVGEEGAEGEDTEVGPGGDNKKTKKSKAALEEQEDEVSLICVFSGMGWGRVCMGVGLSRGRWLGG